MDVVEMLIAVVVVVVGDHLIGLAFEAHTLVASTASDPVAAVNTDHGDLALLVRALPDPVFPHVLLECFVSSIPRLLACYPRVIAHLNKIKITLHSMQ